MEIEVKNCWKCPMLFLNRTQMLCSAYKNGRLKEIVKPKPIPDNCPLRKEPITIKLEA